MALRSRSQLPSTRSSQDSLSDPCEEFSSLAENLEKSKNPDSGSEPKPRAGPVRAAKSIFKEKIVIRNIKHSKAKLLKKNILADEELPPTRKSVALYPFASNKNVQVDFYVAKRNFIMQCYIGLKYSI